MEGSPALPFVYYTPAMYACPATYTAITSPEGAERGQAHVPWTVC